MNEALVGTPDEHGNFQAIKRIDGESAAGPDGFVGCFYKACWNVLKADFCKAINEFFQGRELPKIWTRTMLVAIPKIDNPRTFGDLRPISLCEGALKDIDYLIESHFTIVDIRGT